MRDLPGELEEGAGCGRWVWDQDPERRRFCGLKNTPTGNPTRASHCGACRVKRAAAARIRKLEKVLQDTALHHRLFGNVKRAAALEAILPDWVKDMKGTK